MEIKNKLQGGEKSKIKKKYEQHHWIFIIRIGEEMVREVKKFYYYRLKGKELPNRWKIDFYTEIEADKPNKLDLNNITISDKGFDFTFTFEAHDELFYGTITKSKQNDAFETRSKHQRTWESLKSKVGEGDTRESSGGVSHFVFGKEKNDIVVLMEKGYQVGGIDKLTDFFNDFLKSKNMEVKKELLKTPQNIQVIKEMVLSDTLKRMEIFVQEI